MKRIKILSFSAVLVIIACLLSGCFGQDDVVVEKLKKKEDFNLTERNIVYTAKTEQLRYIKYNTCVTITECVCDDIDIIIPSTIEDLPVIAIEEAAFKGATNLQRVVIGSNILSIGPSAFESCESLITVQMSNSVNEIGENAFRDCRALKSIIVPAAVDIIPSGMCSGCDSLIKVIIESRSTSDNELVKNRTEARSVTDAFGDCDSLRAIWIPSDIASIEGEIGTKDTVIYSVPQSKTEKCSAARYAAIEKYDFGITNRDEFDAAVRSYNPISEEMNYDAVGKTITAGAFKITLKSYDFKNAIGSISAESGFRFAVIVFQVSNTASYSKYFNGLAADIYSWAREQGGIMKTYIKSPMLIGKEKSGFDFPSGEILAGETKECAVIVKVNRKSNCVSIQFPDAKDTFYIH